jgi:hypothetical protein
MDPSRTHIHTAILREVCHLAHQVSVPEEPVIRPLPERQLARSLPATLRLLLPLKGVRQVEAVREPEPCRLETLLDQRDELLLDGVLEDGGRGGEGRQREESEVGSEVDRLGEEAA